MTVKVWEGVTAEMPFDLSSQIAVYQMGREREGYPRQRDSVYKSGK